MNLSGIKYYRVRMLPNGRIETLANIAEQFYGDPGFAMTIYEHNRHYIANPNQLSPGQLVALPHIASGAVVVGELA